MLLTIFRGVDDHVMEDIIAVLIDKYRAWEASVESVGELNETVVE